MNKLENVSGNFLEMVKCVQNGEAIQWYCLDGKWYDGYYDPKKPYLSVEELCASLSLKWRKKPDAFKEAYMDWYKKKGLSTMDEVVFKAGWNAAMEHRADD